MGCIYKIIQLLKDSASESFFAPCPSYTEVWKNATFRIRRRISTFATKETSWHIRTVANLVFIRQFHSPHNFTATLDDSDNYYSNYSYTADEQR